MPPPTPPNPTRAEQEAPLPPVDLSAIEEQVTSLGERVGTIETNIARILELLEPAEPS